MSNPIRDALRYDPLTEAEKITGCDYKDDEYTTVLGMILAQAHGAEKRKLLSDNNDVHMQSTLEEYLAVVASLGFEEILNETIPGTEDRYMVFWRNGVLLDFDTYFDGKSINSANLNLQFQGSRADLPPSSNGFAGEVDGESVWYMRIDAREGLRFNLEHLEERGTILPKWVTRPFLWLLHYRDTKQDGYDYKAINKARIAKFPQHVREAMVTP